MFLGVWVEASASVGLDGCAESLVEDVRECVGGVGGSSGLLPTLLDWCLKTCGLAGCEFVDGAEASAARSS